MPPDDIKTAFLCPGQGAQSPAMAELILENPRACELLGLAADMIGEDLKNIAHRDVAFFSRNEVSAILVSVASIAAYDKLIAAGYRADFFAGYSVGQWTAMHLAGMIDAESLMRVLVDRAALMNKTRAVKEGGMLAVIGLPRDKVEDVIRNIKGYIIIANDNAPGQYTLSGECAAIEVAEQMLAVFKPQRLLRVPVAGAWHCQMVNEASGPFEKYLEGVGLKEPAVPVISNVTAQPLPQDPARLRAELAAHVSSPVMWSDTIRYMMGQGAMRFIEVGHEQTLSKFGFFIDRSRQHMPWTKLVAV